MEFRALSFGRDERDWKEDIVEQRRTLCYLIYASQRAEELIILRTSAMLGLANFGGQTLMSATTFTYPQQRQVFA